MISLDKIHNKKQQYLKYQEEHLSNYTIGNPVPIISKIIKKQNLLLLHWIAQHKKLSKLETLELIEKYHKLNYYCPTIKNI